MRDNPQMFEITYACSVLKPDSNCVDIGANEGDMLRQMTTIAPAGIHHAFEPIPTLAAKLKIEYPRVPCPTKWHSAITPAVLNFRWRARHPRHSVL